MFKECDEILGRRLFLFVYFFNVVYRALSLWKTRTTYPIPILRFFPHSLVRRALLKKKGKRENKCREIRIRVLYEL